MRDLWTRITFRRHLRRGRCGRPSPVVVAHIMPAVYGVVLVATFPA